RKERGPRDARRGGERARRAVLVVGAGHVEVSPAVQRHRERVLKAHRVRNAEQLVKLVDALGFAFAFTLRTGDAPIPACFDHLSTNDTDRKWGWMWGWKDELPEAKKLYYGVLLSRKPTFVSL